MDERTNVQLAIHLANTHETIDIPITEADLRVMIDGYDNDLAIYHSPLVQKLRNAVEKITGKPYALGRGGI
jgi:hypothetical protein